MREMKDSKVEWIGFIPLEWKLVKYKRICNVFAGGTPDTAKQEYYDGTIPWIQSGKIQNCEVKECSRYITKFGVENSSTKFIPKNTALLAMTGATCGNVGYSKIDLYANQSVMAFVNNNTIDSRFIYYSLYIQKDGILINQNGSAQAGINVENGKNLYMPYPNSAEQQRIANFLDEKVTKIDKVIEKTKEIIEDYKKYKQSIITNAVTKGLDKNVEMKDSSIEWIGEIPGSWKTIKIKYTSYLEGRIGWQGLNSGDYKEEGAFLITGTDFKNGQIEWNTCVHISEERFQEAPEIHIKENDLLITKDGTIGKLAIVKNCPNKVSINSGVLLIRNTPKFKYNKRFLYYVLQSEQFKLWYALSQTGNSTIKHLYQEQFANFIFTYPDLQLQEDIISYLDKKCNKIDKIIYQKENLIEELENYKRSLIYEYVTGKKEVKSSKVIIKDKEKYIKINCKDSIFAQAILLCKIIEKLNNYNLGRVKAEKTLYLIEKEVGFDFDNNYAREAAGPLSEAIYKCEAVISKSNKWVKVNNVKKHIEYEVLPDFNKYKQYYNKYYSAYDSEIERIINIIKKCDLDKAEMLATLYASWNDFIIKGEKVSDIQIVKDVRENWNDTKKRFSEEEWLEVLKEMKQIGLIPKGNGNLTIIKEQ